jgi:uncharacterized protein
VDSDVAGRIIAEVRVSLVRWEPRIRVRDVEVTVSPDDPTLVYIDIRYTIVDTNDPRNLVVPFYTIPAEE